MRALPAHRQPPRALPTTADPALQVWLINESRTNPTLMNDVPVTSPICLAQGDIFSIAGRCFRFEYRA
jgi:hypothetical protein